jgi:cytochrome c-type biogenesis protein CcmH
MKVNKLTSLSILTVVLVFTLVSPTLAQESTPQPTPSDDEVNAIAKNMYCPVCENTPLDQCATEACKRWREEIRDKLSLGWTEDEIYDYFALKHGDQVLSIPPATGLNWLVRIIPPLAFVVGAYILYRGFRMWRKPIEDEEIETAQGEDDEYVSRLEEELKKRQ